MEERDINISISIGTILKTLVVLGGAALLFYLRDLALIVLTAIVIASAIEPGVRALGRYKVPRILGVIIVYLLVFSVFFILFYFFLPSVLEDFATFIASLPTYLDAFARTGAFDQYATILGLEGSSADALVESAKGALDFSDLFSNAFTAASAIFGGFFSFILIVVFSFYFAVIETGVDDFLRIATPKRHQSYVMNLWRRAQHKIGLWMQGQLLLGVIIGVLVYLGLTILGVKHALVLAVIAALFELIPVFGPTLSAVPAVTIAFVDGGATLGILTIGLYVVAQQFENHLIYPLVVTRVVGVPPLLVILALIVGGELAGFLGIILSVPIASTIQELAKDIESGRFGKEMS